MDKKSLEAIIKAAITGEKKPIKLDYDYNTRQFRSQCVDKILLSGVGGHWRKEATLPYYYIHDYYPKNKYGTEMDEIVDDTIIEVRELIYNFKDGRNSSEIASLIYDALVREKRNDLNSCLCIIPASKPEKTQIRFKEFCDILSSKLNVMNGYDAITAKLYKAIKGFSGKDEERVSKIDYFIFKEKIFQGKDILLFDDIRTSGSSFKQTAKRLLELGAKSVTGIFLAKAKI